jgi:hypothetical protein
MRKKRKQKRVIFAVVIFVILLALFFWFTHSNNPPQKETPKTHTVQSIVPISINTKNIKEENFSGTIPVISGSSKLATEASAYIAQKVGEFRKQANTDVPDMQKKFGADSPAIAYEIDIDAKDTKSEKTESIIMSIYTFTGGANGNSSYHVLTALLSDSKILSLVDVVKQDKKTALTAFVKKELDAWQPEGSDTPVVFTEEVKNLTFDSFTNWSLSDKNLIIYFDKYDIGPGVLGAVAFPLPLDKIKDFLNPNF